MAKLIACLTEQQVAEAEPRSKSHKLFDGSGLYLEVMPTETKVWRMKFRQLNKKDQTLTFGHYPEGSLDLARSRRSRWSSRKAGRRRDPGRPLRAVGRQAVQPLP